MIDASERTDPAPATADPTLAALVPRPSRVRNALLAALALVALAATVALPAVLGPGLSSGSAGIWTVVPSRGQVLAMTLTTSATVPRVDLAGVEDVPGARVAQVWVLPESARDEGFVGTPEEFAEVGDYLAAAFPGADVAAAGLPQSVDSRDESWIVVLWELTDCAALPAEAHPQARIRTVWGTAASVPLDAVVGPSFSQDDLLAQGACP